MCAQDLFRILAIATVRREESDNSDERNENTRHNKCCDVIGGIALEH